MLTTIKHQMKLGILIAVSAVFFTLILHGGKTSKTQSIKTNPAECPIGRNGLQFYGPAC